MSKPEERRRFLKQSAWAVGGLALGNTFLTQCTPAAKATVKGTLMGPSHKAGHLLRTGINLVPTATQEVDVVIVGGGVSGLSAARWLTKHSNLSVLLLELENQTGGNSLSGKNAVSAYPWGAHYLPLPNNTNQDLLAFLQEENVVTGYTPEGLPLYNEYHLCFDPEERLFINGYWQEGLVPNWSVPEEDKKQIQKFLALMEEMKVAKGKDGRYAFDIPLDQSSSDSAYQALDQKTMQAWLQQHALTSEYLRWYVEYCCLDDFGSTLEQTSAWAGIHYFAARKAAAGNSDAHRVLTWPQGNHWLANRLKAQTKAEIRPDAVVYKVHLQGEKVLVDFLQLTDNQAVRIKARQCIMATPHFVTERLLTTLSLNPSKNFTYAPWLVANLTLKQLPRGRGMPLSWDNVIYGSKSLGYVYANHQHLEGFPDKQVITFYHPLAEATPQNRQAVYSKDHTAWSELVLNELEKAHPSIREEIEQLDVWVWGHGMIRPTPGFIWGEDRQKEGQPLHGKIAFAHSDLSGISVFEEAFYQGIKAARHLLAGV